MPRPRQLAAGGSAGRTLRPTRYRRASGYRPHATPATAFLFWNAKRAGHGGKQRRGATGLAKASELASLPG